MADQIQSPNEEEMGIDTVVTDALRKKFRINDDENSDKRLRTSEPWQHIFPRSMVEEACSDRVQKCVKDYYGYDRFQAKVCPADKAGQEEAKKATGSPYYSVRFDYIPHVGYDWEPNDFICDCAEAKNGRICLHEAAVLWYAQKQKGGLFVSEETWEEQDDRNAANRVRKRREKLAEEHRKLGAELFPVLSFYPDWEQKKGSSYYDCRTALKAYKTDAFAVAYAKEVRDWYTTEVSVEEETGRDGTHTIAAELVLEDSYTSRKFKAGYAELTGTELYVDAKDGYMDNRGEETKLYHDMGPVDPVNDARPEKEQAVYLNMNALVLVKAIWDKANQLVTKQRDITDRNADQFFFSLVDEKEEAALEQAGPPQTPREKTVHLLPRIQQSLGEVQFSIRIQSGQGRAYLVKNIKDLVASAENRGVFPLGKSDEIDFAGQDFDPDSAKLYQLILQTAGPVRKPVLEKEGERKVYRAAVPFPSIPLKGVFLDSFAELWSGKTLSYDDKTNDVSGTIPVGSTRIHLEIEADPVEDVAKNFLGVSVHGVAPAILKGAGRNRYALSAEGLGKVSKEDWEVLRPFENIADSSGFFRFEVGLPRLQDFYYRVVPKLLNSPFVNFTDNSGEQVEKILPPEPRFVFYLDQPETGEMTGDGNSALFLVSLSCKVHYETKNPDGTTDEKIYELARKSLGDGYRDRAQEDRTERAVRKVFSDTTVGDGTFSALFSEESLYDFLSRGIAVLEAYGEVQGSDAFRRHGIRKVPPIKVGISVKSGVCDLSLTSEGLSREELLAVLQSYRAKKRWHRLRSGAFLDLEGDETLKEAQDFLQGCDLAPEDIAGKDTAIPVYRALYVDKLLEEHEALQASRDRTLRAIARNFRNIRDSEIEPPKSLEGVLRPYQVYGYKWLRTLELSGFGGILADEMGLGKTLQMISVLLAFYGDKKEGEKRNPSLIICPASLVYNWQEEFTKFAPALIVQPLAGPAAQRKKALDAWDATDVYVISYDLFKRNITSFDDRTFAFAVLDEAQVIKNAGAAVTKAVKVLRADHRFALTGTPIENRLSELWSIFDFLMPGFLYTRKEFEEKFEIPITKDRDAEATEKLRKMTAPFLLRRKKADVLRDLPAKLEEVRYVPLSGTQQKLYDAEVSVLRDRLKSEEDSRDRIQVFAQLTRIREVCCDPSLLFENYDGESAKREAVMGLIQQAMDGGHRMLLFSQFTSMLALLEEDLKKAGIPYYLLTGATPKEKRIQLVHQFNEGDVPVFLISLKAGGTGLNLTGADVVIHYDPWWNLAAQNQATDRAHRIGQEKEVTVYRMIMRSTIEERILELQERKKDLAESVLAGSETSLSHLSREELLELLS